MLYYVIIAPLYIDPNGWYDSMARLYYMTSYFNNLSTLFTSDEEPTIRSG